MDGLRSDLKQVSSDAQMEANASSLMRERLNSELSELKRWRADAERRLQSHSDQKAGLEEGLKKASAEKASLSEAVEALERRAGLAGTELEGARRDAAELRASATAASLARDAVLREVEVLRGWKADAERSHGTQTAGLRAAYEEASRELVLARDEASSLGTDLAALRLENETLLREVRLVGDARASAEGRLRESSDELARLGAELDAKSADVGALTLMLKSIGSTAEHEAAVEAMRRERSEVESKLVSQEEALMKSKAEKDDAVRKHAVDMGRKNEEINLIYGDLAEAKTACSSLEGIIKEMAGELNTKDSALEAKEEVIRDLRCQIDYFEMISTLDTSHAGIGGHRKQASLMADQNTDKKVRVSTLSASVSQSQCDSSVQMAEPEELSRLKNELEAADTKIEELNREIVRLTAECKGKQEYIVNTDADVSLLQGECEGHLATIRERNNQIELLETKLNRHEIGATARYQEELLTISQERDALRQSMSTQRADISRLESNNVEILQDANELRAWKEGAEHLLEITSKDKMASEILAQKLIDLEREVERQRSKHQKAVKALAALEEALLVRVLVSAFRCPWIWISPLMMSDG